MHRKQSFPHFLQHALDEYEQSYASSKLKTVKRIHPSIIRLKALPEKDKTNNFALYQCFANNIPKNIKSNAYLVYTAMLKDISVIPFTTPVTAPRRTTLKDEKERVQCVADALVALNKMGLLKQPYFDAVTTHLQPIAVVDAVALLKRKKLFDNDAITDMVLHHPQPDQAADAIVELAELKIPINKMILDAFQYPHKTKDIKEILCDLKQLNLLNSDHINLIMTHKDPIEAIGVIKTLARNKFPVDADNRSILTVLRHESPTDLAQALVMLRKELEIDKTGLSYYEYIIHNQFPTVYAKILLSLHLNNKYSSDNVRHVHDLFYRFNFDPKNNLSDETILEHRTNFLYLFSQLERFNLVNMDNIKKLLNPNCLELLDTRTMEKYWNTFTDKMTQDNFDIVIKNMMLKHSEAVRGGRKLSGIFENRGSREKAQEKKPLLSPPSPKK